MCKQERKNRFHSSLIAVEILAIRLKIVSETASRTQLVPQLRGNAKLFGVNVFDAICF